MVAWGFPTAGVFGLGALGDPVSLERGLPFVGACLFVALAVGGVGLWRWKKSAGLGPRRAEETLAGPPLTWKKTTRRADRLVHYDTVGMLMRNPADPTVPPPPLEVHAGVLPRLEISAARPRATRLVQAETLGLAQCEAAEVPRATPPRGSREIADDFTEARVAVALTGLASEQLPTAPATRAMNPSAAAPAASPPARSVEPFPVVGPQPPAARRSAAPSAASPRAALPGRAPALPLEIPVALHGSRYTAMLRGQFSGNGPFHEETSTLIVFPGGAVIALGAKVEPDEMVILTNQKTGEAVSCRVVAVRPNPNAKSHVKIHFAQAASHFWGVRFPSEPSDAPAGASPDHAASAQTSSELEPAPPVGTRA